MKGKEYLTAFFLTTTSLFVLYDFVLSEKELKDKKNHDNSSSQTINEKITLQKTQTQFQSPVHEIRYRKNKNNQLYGSVYLLPVVDNNGSKKLALAKPTTYNLPDGRSFAPKNAPLILTEQSKTGTSVIQTKKVFEYLVGNKIEDASIIKEGNIKRIEITKPGAPNAGGWSNRFSVSYESGAIFAGKYADFTTVRRPDNRGGVTYVDTGRDGIVDFILLNNYVDSTEIIDYSHPERHLDQRIATIEKDSLVKLIEKDHKQCNIGRKCLNNSMSK